MKWRELRGYLLSAALVLVIVALLALQVIAPWRDDQSPGPEPWPISENDGVAIGVTTLSLARNAFRPWRTDDLSEVNAFEQDARLHADIVMWFLDWERGTFAPAQARAVAERGSTPEISWEPWDSRIAPRVPQPAYALERIIEGRHDAYIRSFAEAVRRYGRPLRLRFAQEMNGGAYPWSEAQNGNARGEFVKAWRHVHRIFTSAGASNVTWIWSPVAGTIHEGQYPGSRYVDIVGLSGFNGGTTLFAKRWRSFEEAFGPPLDAIRALAADKPVALTEIASAEQGGSKSRWIDGMFAGVRRRPYIRAVVWFNLRKETDWRIESSPEARAAFAAGAATVRSVSRAAR
jgi:beta-mannanase